jgi:hypothetical protein
MSNNHQNLGNDSMIRLINNEQAEEEESKDNRSDSVMRTSNVIIEERLSRSRRYSCGEAEIAFQSTL